MKAPHLAKLTSQSTIVKHTAKVLKTFVTNAAMPITPLRKKPSVKNKPLSPIVKLIIPLVQPVQLARMNIILQPQALAHQLLPLSPTA